MIYKDATRTLKLFSFHLNETLLFRSMDERKAAIIDCLLARAHTTVESHLRRNDDLAATFRKQLVPVFGLSQVKVQLILI